MGGQPRLTKAQNGEEVLLEIEYRDRHVQIVHCEGTTEPSIFTILIRDSQLQEFWLLLKDNTKWKFAYNIYGPLICHSNIRSPLGLVEAVTYDSSDLQLPSGGLYKYLPAVKQHINKPGNQ